MAEWLLSAWGKFRGWQTVCATPQRLSAEQKRAAWLLWDLMRCVESADAGDDEALTDRLHAATVRFVRDLDPDLRKGPRIFSRWLVENRGRLAEPVARAVAESAQTTDTVTAQLIS